MTERRRPLHVGVYLGLSAGAYALCLATMTALQSQSEAAVAADRSPTRAAIAGLAAQNAELEADARRAVLAYEGASSAYGRLGQTLADVEDGLSDLAKVVGAVDGAARSLPDHVALPKVTRSVTAVRPPKTHATTGASG